MAIVNKVVRSIDTEEADVHFLFLLFSLVGDGYHALIQKSIQVSKWT